LTVDNADAKLSIINCQLSIKDIIADIAQRIFNGEKITYDPDLLRITVKPYLDGIAKGYGKTLAEVDWDTPDAKTLQKLTENVFQFSASKDFHILSDMTAALKDSNGKLRSFDDFQAEVDKMNVKYNGNWLRTEYNQAVAASQNAARWTDFEKHSKTMPFLQYQAVMDQNTRAEHAALNGVIKRIDSDFWDKYYPPNGWGCRCEVIQLPGKNHKETPDMDIKFTKVDSMFQVNVGKKGVVFPKGHPYFMGQCKRCSGTPQNLALKPQCAACQSGRKDCKRFLNGCKKENALLKEFENNKRKKESIKTTRNNVMAAINKDTFENELFGLGNIRTGFLYSNRGSLKNLLKHSYTEAEIETAISAAHHLDKLKFVRSSYVGEGKDMKDPLVQAQIKRKKAEGIIQYNIYFYEYKGRRWCIKTEEYWDGQERLYSFTKKP